MAWKHERDHHLIKFRTGLPDELRTHQMAHELSHLQLESEARQVGQNRFFVTTTKSEQTAFQIVESDIRKLERKGYPAAAAKNLAFALIRGLAGFLFNCPLDMRIEARLRERMPTLSAGQFVALRMGALEALESQTNPKILEVTPRVILRAGMALNGAYALFLDDIFTGRPSTHWPTSVPSRSMCRSACSGTGRRVARNLGRVTNTHWWMNLPTWLVCAAGMNGNLIPAHIPSMFPRTRKARPIPIFCGERPCPPFTIALMP